jgi:hypothetical protein
MSKKPIKVPPSTGGQVAWDWAQKPVQRSVVRRVARAWGIEFPDDYVACAMANHGGHPTPQCFDMPRRKEAMFNRLLAYTGKTGRIERTFEAIKDRLPASVYPFADDPFGNHLCIDYRKGKPVVVFWDHEVAAEDPAASVTRVCGTFTELLGMLYEPD